MSRLDKPTMFKSAIAIAAISTVMIFIVVEVLLIVFADVGIGLTIDYLTILIVMLGVIIGSSVLFWLTSRKSITWS